MLKNRIWFNSTKSPADGAGPESAQKLARVNRCVSATTAAGMVQSGDANICLPM